MMLQYVDDAVLLARSPKELQHMIKDIAGGKSYQAVRSPWESGTKGWIFQKQKQRMKTKVEPGCIRG